MFLLNAANGSGSFLTSGILLIGLLVVMYFVMLRPQRKQEKRLAEQRAKLRVGDHIITTGGLVGKVVQISDHEVTFATSPIETLITIRKEAINTVLPPKVAEVEK